MIEDQHQGKTDDCSQGVGDQVVDIGKALEVKKVVPNKLVGFDEETEAKAVHDGSLKGGPIVKEKDVDAQRKGHHNVQEKFDAESLKGDDVVGDAVKVEEDLLG